MKRNSIDFDFFNDAIELVVGGKKMFTTHDTLMKQPESALAKRYQAYYDQWDLIRKHWINNPPPAVDGDVGRPELQPLFIDSDPKIFARVLQGLRTDSINPLDEPEGVDPVEWRDEIARWELQRSKPFEVINVRRDNPKRKKK